MQGRDAGAAGVSMSLDVIGVVLESTIPYWVILVWHEPSEER